MVAMEVNFVPVLVSAVAGFFIGFLWYGPLFGKTWMKLAGMTEKDIEKAKKKGMGKTMGFSIAASLVMSFVTAVLLSNMGVFGITNAVLAGILIWAGYIATTFLNSVLWENKPVNLYAINAGHYLAVIIAMSVILTLWI